MKLPLNPSSLSRASFNLALGICLYILLPFMEYKSRYVFSATESSLSIQGLAGFISGVGRRDGSTSSLTEDGDVLEILNLLKANYELATTLDNNLRKNIFNFNDFKNLFENIKNLSQKASTHSEKLSKIIPLSFIKDTVEFSKKRLSKWFDKISQPKIRRSHTDTLSNALKLIITESEINPLLKPKKASKSYQLDEVLNQVKSGVLRVNWGEKIDENLCGEKKKLSAEEFNKVASYVYDSLCLPTSGTHRSLCIERTIKSYKSEPSVRFSPDAFFTIMNSNGKMNTNLKSIVESEFKRCCRAPRDAPKGFNSSCLKKAQFGLKEFKEDSDAKSAILDSLLKKTQEVLDELDFKFDGASDDTVALKDMSVKDIVQKMTSKKFKESKIKTIGDLHAIYSKLGTAIAKGEGESLVEKKCNQYLGKAGGRAENSKLISHILYYCISSLLFEYKSPQIHGSQKYIWEKQFDDGLKNYLLVSQDEGEPGSGKTDVNKVKGALAAALHLSEVLPPFSETEIGILFEKDGKDKSFDISAFQSTQLEFSRMKHICHKVGGAPIGDFPLKKMASELGFDVWDLEKDSMPGGEQSKYEFLSSLEGEDLEKYMGVLFSISDRPLLITGHDDRMLLLNKFILSDDRKIICLIDEPQTSEMIKPVEIRQTDTDRAGAVMSFIQEFKAEVTDVINTESGLEETLDGGKLISDPLKFCEEAKEKVISFFKERHKSIAYEKIKEELVAKVTKGLASRFGKVPRGNGCYVGGETVKIDSGKLDRGEYYSLFVSGKEVKTTDELIEIILSENLSEGLNITLGLNENFPCYSPSSTNSMRIRNNLITEISRNKYEGKIDFSTFEKEVHLANALVSQLPALYNREQRGMVQEGVGLVRDLAKYSSDPHSQGFANVPLTYLMYLAEGGKTLSETDSPLYKAMAQISDIEGITNHNRGIKPMCKPMVETDIEYEEEEEQPSFKYGAVFDDAEVAEEGSFTKIESAKRLLKFGEVRMVCGSSPSEDLSLRALEQAGSDVPVSFIDTNHSLSYLTQGDESRTAENLLQRSAFLQAFIKKMKEENGGILKKPIIAFLGDHTIYIDTKGDSCLKKYRDCGEEIQGAVERNEAHRFRLYPNHVGSSSDPYDVRKVDIGKVGNLGAGEKAATTNPVNIFTLDAQITQDSFLQALGRDYGRYILKEGTNVKVRGGQHSEEQLKRNKMVLAFRNCPKSWQEKYLNGDGSIKSDQKESFIDDFFGRIRANKGKKYSSRDSEVEMGQPEPAQYGTDRRRTKITYPQVDYLSMGIMSGGAAASKGRVEEEGVVAGPSDAESKAAAASIKAGAVDVGAGGADDEDKNDGVAPAVSGAAAVVALGPDEAAAGGAKIQAEKTTLNAADTEKIRGLEAGGRSEIAAAEAKARETIFMALLSELRRLLAIKELEHSFFEAKLNLIEAYAGSLGDRFTASIGEIIEKYKERASAIESSSGGGTGLMDAQVEAVARMEALAVQADLPTEKAPAAAATATEVEYAKFNLTMAEDIPGLLPRRGEGPRGILSLWPEELKLADELPAVTAGPSADAPGARLQLQDEDQYHLGGQGGLRLVFNINWRAPGQPVAAPPISAPAAAEALTKASAPPHCDAVAQIQGELVRLEQRMAILRGQLDELQKAPPPAALPPPP